ncbi:M23 family metallopeptidase [Knoellia subterranea]|uniref:Metalloendopeptidase n=1 Tax=Knoellia subterranea KCTC 19937 TaxID=1385521 RepID=A0A0A0JTW6_9MICO|nr:M23 family metallopeptidase [Knoellia subterranea]KGN39492.1 metalloendopeptidase [Knoellia subterranea KCTC 19937]
MKHISTRLLAGLALVVGYVFAGAPSAHAAINHEVPFPCGQTWSGQTRTNHSPQRAIDFNRTNDTGDAVAASAAGTVVHRGSMAGTSYGNLVVIRHSDGTATYYAHLSGFNVSNGQSVSQGQVIGYVGGTGFPKTPGGFGAHLHYEQRTSFGGSAVSIRFDGVTARYYGTKNYTSSNRCGGASNPYTPAKVCGSGYAVIDSAAIGTKGRTYLLYNSGNGNNCVVTLKSSGFTASSMTAFLEVQGQSRVTDSGSYTYYAGPVRKAAPGTCVKWGGAITGTGYTSPFEHCG